MQTVYGQFNSAGGADLLVGVNFPSLATLDQETGDGRLVEAAGFGVRDLPRSIMAQFHTEGGHNGAVVVGTLQEVTVHDDGNVSGRGWLADIPEARHLAVLINTGSLRHNSIDMAEVEVELEWKSDDPSSPDFWEYTLRFTKSKLAATTFVNVPAFANAHGELMASVGSETLTAVFDEHDYEIELAPEEITASLATEVTVPWADFHHPEERKVTKIQVDEHGHVYGHLAPWGACHRGIEGKCVLAPRPRNYASFAAPSVLTERGMVETGPIFFLGGHPEGGLNGKGPWAAYGGIENAWADVTITNGILGPWISGRVRPGLSAEAVYAARASRISGHWLGDQLMAIVSCNAEAFNTPGSGKQPSLLVPGSTMRADRDGIRVENGRVVELVASVGRIPDEPEEDPEEMRKRLAAKIASKFNGTTVTLDARGNATMTVCAPATSTIALGQSAGTSTVAVLSVDPDSEIPGEVVEFDEVDYDAEALALELEIELDA